MSNKKPNSTKKAPAFIAYAVRDGAEDQSYWTRIGVAFNHEDGKGMNIQLSALPLDGRIVLRVPEAKE